ncbi:uncharacterized protein LOC128279160 [Anopheles cruzii]|uniref:uncharacterized protein LOC128279160 n=1 Tax=Anopheles cruzii TaxID=68878 RepID=UPI0022EC89AB|nr:uncharacterized protein LOC128279160 [Anopheles cruzii]
MTTPTPESCQLIIPRVDVVFLSYRHHPQDGRSSVTTAPTVTLDSICTISRYELQQHLRVKRTERHSMSEDAYRHYRWYNAALAAELKTIGSDSRDGRPLLRVFHWYIETSNEAAFRIEGKQYEAVSFVLAAEIEHWYCSAGVGQAVRHGRRVRMGDQPSLLTHDVVRHRPATGGSNNLRKPRKTFLQSIGEEVEEPTDTAGQ